MTESNPMAPSISPVSSENVGTAAKIPRIERNKVTPTSGAMARKQNTPVGSKTSVAGEELGRTATYSAAAVL